MVLLLVGGFVGGYFTGRAADTDPIGMAPQAMVDKIDSWMQANNDGDADAFSAFFAGNAVLRNGFNSEQIQGAQAITDFLLGGTVERTSEVVVHGNLYSFGYRHTNSSGVMVMRFNPLNGLIEYVCIIL